jgi:chromosome segregation ATPase
MPTLFSLTRAALAFAALVGTANLFAQAPVDPAGQLREALRATTLQLRTAEGNLAVAQAERDQARDDLAALQKRFEALQKEAAADRATARAEFTDISGKLARKDAENARLADALKLARDATDQAGGLAAERADRIAVLEQQAIEADRTLADLRRRNRSLFELGSEILNRYEAFGLGRAIGAREPFTKLSRVKLQNEVQEHADALEESREKLPADPAAEESPAATVAE